MNRRSFLSTGSALALAALPRGLPRRGAWLDVPPAGSPELKALAHTALDAARAAGAQYADVVFRTTRFEHWARFSAWEYQGGSYEFFTEGLGVRALVGGCWGVAGMDGRVTTDDVARLGREAAAQAATGAKHGGASVELAPAPIVSDGHWVTPIERDPFTVPASEKIDFLLAMNDFGNGLAWDVNSVESRIRFRRVDTTMASTEGTDYAQTTYTTEGAFRMSADGNCLEGMGGGGCDADFLTPAGAGWEYIRSAPFRDAAPALLEIARRTRSNELVEPGRYDLVFDANAMASILSATLGAATAVDRAMGQTADGVGTSYLADPLGMLGTFQVAAPGVTIAANRSMPRGAATVRWDDEGVAPSETTLVTNGVLTDFQTTRESARWLAPYYERTGRPVRSNGSAGREQVTGLPAQCPPNLTLAPGREALTFEDLVRSTKRGYAICGGRPSMDWQAATGEDRGERMYVIRDGRLGPSVSTYRARCLFSTAELWKNIVALGGPASVRGFGVDVGAGRAHTVVAVPAKVARLRLIDPQRTL